MSDGRSGHVSGDVSHNDEAERLLKANSRLHDRGGSVGEGDRSLPSYLKSSSPNRLIYLDEGGSSADED